MEKPKISVIVPIYNSEKYLEICLKSIQNQSLKDIEIILIDDGSTDNSGKIADDFSINDSRIKVIHQKNKGLSCARNFGIKISKGEYISFIDSDDWIEPTMFDELYNIARENFTDILVSGVVVEYPIENRSIIYIPNESIFTKEKSVFGELFLELYNCKLSNYAWNKLYKTSFLKENDIQFLEDGMPAEDLFFNLTAFLNAESIGVIKKTFYHYMRRDESSILTKYQKNLLYVEKERIRQFSNFFNYFGMNRDEHLIFLDKLIISARLGLLINIYKNNSPLNYRERITFIKNHIISNKDLSSTIKGYKPQNILEIIFVILYKLSNPILMELVYSVLFFFRRRLKKLYLYFRKKNF